MLATLELLDKALQIKPANQWANQFGITRQTISKAKERGRLSPLLAGQFAIEIGEDAVKWIAAAALEAEQDSPMIKRLRATLALHKP